MLKYGVVHNEHTHRAVLGVLRLVGVVIQSDEVEARLHLIAAPAEHVLPAHTLPRVRVTAVGGR